MSVFGSPASKFVCASQALPDSNARKDTKIILVRAECPYVQFGLLVFLHSVHSRGYEQAREETRLQSLYCMGACVCSKRTDRKKGRKKSPERGPFPPSYSPREGTRVGRLPTPALWSLVLMGSADGDAGRAVRFLALFGL